MGKQDNTIIDGVNVAGCEYYFYGDCYAINCGLYNKPLGWHPSVKRCEECLKSTNEFKTKKENKKD